MATSLSIRSSDDSREPLLTTGNQIPLQKKDRLFIIDSIRGIALLGILLMNMPLFGLPYQQSFNLALLNEFSGANYWSWWVVNGLFEGTMRGLFSILFGAGCLLLLMRLERKNEGLIPADIYFRRLLWLLAFGLFNAYILLWPGDILYPYALCGMLLFPFRNLSVRQLLWIFSLIVAITVFRENKPLYDRKEMFAKGRAAELLEKKKATLTEQQKKDLEAWQGFQKKTTLEATRKEADKFRHDVQTGSYSQIYTLYKDFNIKFETTEFYLIRVWDILLFLFLGMILFKSGYLTGEFSAKWYLAGALIGYGIGLPLNYVELKYALSILFDPVKHTDSWFFSYYEIRRLFHTMGHLSLILLLYRSGMASWLFRMMAPVGQMAFTNYLVQSIICGILFHGYAFALYGKLERFQLYEIVGIIWLFQIVFSHVWLHYFQFGPFEWLWRSLTYVQKQPFVKKTEPQPAAIA